MGGHVEGREAASGASDRKRRAQALACEIGDDGSQSLSSGRGQTAGSPVDVTVEMKRGSNCYPHAGTMMSRCHDVKPAPQSRDSRGRVRSDHRQPRGVRSVLSRHNRERVGGKVDTAAAVVQDKPQKHDSWRQGRLPPILGLNRRIAFLAPGERIVECTGCGEPGKPERLTMIDNRLRRGIEDGIGLRRVGRPRRDQAYALTRRKRIERNRRLAHQGRQRDEDWILVCGVACAKFLRHHQRSARKTAAQALAKDRLFRDRLQSVD